MAQRVLIRPEQLYVTAWEEGKVLIGGARHEHLPWSQLGGSLIYALRVEDLELLLADAAVSGYQVVDGFHSDRRGLRGVMVGIGAWGHRGTVECRTLDIWGFDPEDFTGSLEECVAQGQAQLRALCVRLNSEPSPFRSSAFRWLGAVYDRICAPVEPDGRAATLPASVAELCRAAHIGGPILHARTSLEPFVSIDRTRAYGQAMLGKLPSGSPYEAPLPGPLGLKRWRPRDLMGMAGVAVATVHVEPGPLVPLLPVLKRHNRFERARTIYPVGTFRGAWCSHELAALERSGRGKVTELHRFVGFDQVPVLAPAIRYVRSLESDLPIAAKRLEHMLYGRCARGLSLNRLGTGPSGRRPMPRDLLDSRTARRLKGHVDLRHCPLRIQRSTVRHPVMRLTGQLSAQSEWGTMDRPDRSAWITATNRVAVLHLIEDLDAALGVDRSGSYVGRIYVDGIAIEATPDQVPEMPGSEVRRHGPSMHIYRSGAVVARLTDGSVEVEGAGLVPAGSTEKELLAALQHMPDPDGGPFAGGRFWPATPNVEDPRSSPGVVSEPPEVDLESLAALGFTDTADLVAS